jgi:transglutaminase-like putative cysteine protease
VFLPGAELALAGLTTATVLGFWRVFDRGTFLPPMLAVSLVAHLLLVVCRRRGWSVPTAAAVSAPLSAVAGAWLVFPATTLAGLPTGDTISAVENALRESWQQFGNILAPAPPSAGFVVASCVALYFSVFLADWAAFRLWSSFEAVVPATTLFVFCALLGVEHKVESAAAYLGALLVFLLLHRAARQESGSGWLVGDARVGSGTHDPGRRSGPVLVGLSLVAVAVLTGSLIGPRLPGAGSPAVLTWRSSTQASGERKAISPLVRIRDRLLNQPNTPLFRVRSNQPAYWRLTSLETFDGDIWRSQARYGAADGELPGEDPDGEPDVIEQRFEIINLQTMIWAPAAYRPVKLVETKVGLNYNEDSSTLIVEPNSSIDGARYAVQSRYTEPTTDALRTVRDSEFSQEIKDRYLSLPDGFSDMARQEAIKQTAGKDRPFDKAKALQDFFRNTGPNGFQYDTTFDRGHGEDAIGAFLTERRGFCEQFAGTFAAMARSVGLPARVAVGFTQGTIRNSNEPNVYEVTGRQTHAWPEVYLGKYGWIMFEPTPGRGAPNARWTDVVPRQDDGSADVPPVPAPPGTAPPRGTAPGNIDPAPPTTAEVAPSTTTTAPPPEPPAETERALPWRILIVAGAILVGVFVVVLGMATLASLYLAALGSLRQRRRRERWARATDPSRAVLVAWQECLDALRTLGLVPHRTESHDEFAGRVAHRLGDAGPDLLELAESVNRADYAHDLVDEAVATRATATSAVIAEAVPLLATPMQRWRALFDPRPVLGSGRRQPQHTISM